MMQHSQESSPSLWQRLFNLTRHPLRARQPVPPESVEKAQVPGLAGIRGWADAFGHDLQRSLFRSLVEEKTIAEQEDRPLDPEINLLALSGGGANGAFGSGLLCGWTAAGDRPSFKMVTGVSTGALLAPLAFLGPDYDTVHQEVYTGISSSDVYRPKRIKDILHVDSIQDTTPLHQLVSRCVDEDALQAIAVQHARGRRLLIATTNLEAQRGVVWDMGAIAASGHPRALQLFHQIMMASAAIPVAFPPVYIEVEADGKTYDEMHVDGGVTTQVFLYSAAVDPRHVTAAREMGIDPLERPAKIYIVRNARISLNWHSIQAQLLDIAGKSVATLITNQGIGDLYRIFVIAQRDGLDYNLAFIPDEFDVPETEDFDPDYMNQLFEFGHQQALSGQAWQQYPPGFIPSTQE